MRTALILRIPFWLVCPLLLAFAVFCTFIADGTHVSGNTIDDVDTLMRLAWLREVWADGTWHHGFFERNNAPYGMVLHWTLPFNLIVLGLARLFATVLPHDLALHYAGYWTGPLMRMAVAFCAWWAARRLLSPVAATFAAGLILFSPFMLNYGDLGSANHHPLLYLDMLLVAGMGIALTLRPDHALAAVAGGMSAAFAIWCSFELAPLAGGLFAWLFLLWVREGRVRTRQLLLAGCGFAALMDIALLADTPYGGLGTIVFDHVSIALQSLACLPLLVALCIAPWRAESAPRRLALVAIAALVWGGLFLLRYPAILHGVEGGMDPYVATEWLRDIAEVKPMHGWRKIVLYLGPACLAMPLALIFVRRWWGKLIAVALLGTLCLAGQLHYRLAGYPIVAGGLFMGYCLERALGNRRRAVRLAAAAIAGLLFAGYYGVEIAASVFDISVQHPAQDNANTANATNNNGAANNDADADDDDDDDDDGSCDIYTVRKALDALTGHGGGAPIVAADINMASSVLYWTQLRTIAGNYHRDSAGIRDNYRFFRDPGDGTAKAIAARRGIDYVLICGDGSNADYSYSTTAKAIDAIQPGKDATPENTLYSRLVNNDPPPWLKRDDWPDDVETGLLLYEVDRGEE